MAPRIILAIVVSAALVLSLTCTCLAQELQQDGTANLTGIVPCHMSRAQLRIWRSILDIVMAEDKDGRRLHPTLYELYCQAETSGHLIRIEFAKAESSSRAGQFSIETPDPKGIRHVTTIRLNLATIERAYVGESTRYSNGLIPFSGLRTKHRYAEVLGHELAHAVAVFQDAGSLRLYEQLEKEAADLEPGDVNDADGDWIMRLESVKQLMRQIEKPAEAAELEIWRELKKARH